jgi:hypothetical protein
MDLFWRNKLQKWTHVTFEVVTAASMKMTAFWDTAPYSVAEIDRRFRDAYCLHYQGSTQVIAVMEAVGISETSVNFHETTRRSIPEGCHLHTRRHDNLKYHTSPLV